MSKVAFLSVADRGGNTSAVWATAMAMAYKQGKSVRVCYSGENHSIKRYIGQDDDDSAIDVTRSISQVSKLLQARAIGPEELSNYCRKVGPQLELMDTFDPSLSEQEMSEILTFVYERSTVDFTLCDLAYGIHDPISQSILKASDAVIICTEPSVASLELVRQLMEKHKSPKWENIKVGLMVCNFEEEIMPLKKCAALAGFPMRTTCKLHHNPYIRRGCNNQDIQSVFVSAFEKDPRVVELRTDMKEITELLLAYKQEKSHWED